MHVAIEMYVGVKSRHLGLVELDAAHLVNGAYFLVRVHGDRH